MRGSGAAITEVTGRIKTPPHRWINTGAIRNSKLKPNWQAVERNILEIAARTSSSFIRTQEIGDLYREFVGTKAYGFDYNLAFIPSSFNVESKEIFDPEYMGALYQLGYELASKGYPWKKQPPGEKPQ